MHSGPSAVRPSPTSRRRRWALLAVWAAAWCALVSPHGGYSWFYFAHGSVLLFGGHPPGLTAPGGVHLYGNYPQYQIGPLTFLVAALVQPFGVLAAQLLMIGLGLVVLACAERLTAVPHSLRGGTRMLLAEVLFVPVWAELAVHYAHLDDALVLTLSVLAVTAVASGRCRWVGPLLGAAIAAKPWAAAFLPLLWALPSQGRRDAMLWAVALPVLAWLPFVLGDPGTVLATSRFTITNAADSALRALGVTAPRTPSWCRPAQLLLGLGVGAAAVQRGRWPAVLLAGVAARLLLDPGTYDYYTASAMVAALLADLMLRRGSWPTSSIVAFTRLYAVHALSPVSSLQGQIRLGTCALLLALSVLPRRGQPTSPGEGRRPDALSLGAC